MSRKQNTAGANGGISQQSDGIKRLLLSPSIDADALTVKLLADLHRGAGWHFVWTPDTEPKQSRWSPAYVPLSVPFAWMTKNVYFGVHPRRAQLKPWRRGGIADIAVINCLFAEYDLKDYGSKAAMYSHLETLWFYPTAIVDSGGGLHCYWILDHTVRVTDANREELKRLQYAWIDYVGGDSQAKDLARHLRMPGTTNYKPDYAPDFPKVDVIEYRRLRTYGLDRLQELVQERMAREEARSAVAVDYGSIEEHQAAAARQLLMGSVKKAAAGGRHHLGLWLAFKLKEHNLPQWSAESVMRSYAEQVTGLGDHPYREDEALRSLRYAYQG